MTEENNQVDPFDPSTFDFDGVETQSGDFDATAKDGVYPLVLKKVEVGTGELGFNSDESDTRLRANLFYTFADPKNVEKLGDGLLKGINETLWLHTKGSISRLKAFVEAHGVDWKEFSAGLKGKSMDEFRQVLSEQLSSFEGSEAECRVARETGYKNRQTGKFVEFKSGPRNTIAGFVSKVKQKS